MIDDRPGARHAARGQQQVSPSSMSHYCRLLQRYRRCAEVLLATPLWRCASPRTFCSMGRKVAGWLFFAIAWRWQPALGISPREQVEVSGRAVLQRLRASPGPSAPSPAAHACGGCVVGAGCEGHASSTLRLLLLRHLLPRRGARAAREACRDSATASGAIRKISLSARGCRCACRAKAC